MQDIQQARERRPKTTSRQQVYQVIVDNYCANPPIPSTRNGIASQMCIPPENVDTHVNRLIDDGLIDKILPGVLIPLNIRPDRPVSVTRNPGSDLVYEIGDTVEHLSPREVRDTIIALGGVVINDFAREIMAIKWDLKPKELKPKGKNPYQKELFKRSELVP
ncbi:MAG: hypothetical protein KDH18_23395 [Rhodoferax sp.]|nr:hypothetical protein [Rhodoferax sp.]